MSDLTIERPESGYAVWKNRDGDIVCDWNDDANINFPEDLTSHRDIGDLVSVVYKKGFSDGNIQLKQQLESMTNKCAELNYDKNCLISDLNQSKENERKFKKQLEEKEKLIVALDKTRLRFTETISDLTEQKYEIKQQLEDAVEVMNTIERMEEDEEYPATRISKAAKMCRQFLAKYRVEK